MQKLRLFSKLNVSEILIIDDNPDIRNIIRDLINESGYKTRIKEIITSSN